MLELDGSTLEGGGQLVRVALSLSAITSIPIRITRIRANRGSHGRHRGNGGNTIKTAQRIDNRRNHNISTPSRGSRLEGGLKESHLAALNWLAEQCNADVQGAEVGSSEIIFRPGKDRKGRSRNVLDEKGRTIELKKPGSVWLIWQAIFPYIVFANLESSSIPPQSDLTQPKAFEIILKGGTNVSKSMSYEYVTQVFLPMCEKIGLPSVHISLTKRGWAGYASEIGEVKITIAIPTPPHSNPTKFNLPGFNITDRGSISEISISILAHGRIREMLKLRIISSLTSTFSNEIDLDFAIDDDSGDERRLYILLVAHTSNGWRLGRDYLGSGRKPKNEVERRKIVDEAVVVVTRQLRMEIDRGGCVDEYLQDQLVIFQALADGVCTVDAGDGNAEGSLHTRTVKWVCEEMLCKAGLKFGNSGKRAGIGWNKQLQETKDEERMSARGTTDKGVSDVGERFSKLELRQS